jgi:hypothetical protein
MCVGRNKKVKENRKGRSQDKNTLKKAVKLGDET